MLGQHPLQPGPHRLQVDNTFQRHHLAARRVQPRRHQVGHQVARPAQRHRALRDPRQRRQRRLDLLQLDPHAADLDLLVGPAEELHVPSARQRARSPVRYSRAPATPENGSATKRSAVSPARPT